MGEYICNDDSLIEGGANIATRTRLAQLIFLTNLFANSYTFINFCERKNRTMCRTRWASRNISCVLCVCKCVYMCANVYNGAYFTWRNFS